MPSKPLPFDLIPVILDLALPWVSSVTDVKGILLYTTLVNNFRLINHQAREYVDKRPVYFRQCFWSVALPASTCEQQAVDVVNHLRKRCLKADCLLMVLEVSDAAPDAANNALACLLDQLCPKIKQIHLSCPSQCDAPPGVFFFYPLSCWLFTPPFPRRCFGDSRSI